MTKTDMSWRDLLANDSDRVTLPWLGGRGLRSQTQRWTIEERLPPEHGWYRFKVASRRVTLDCAADPDYTQLHYRERGYLVGNRLVAEHARINPDPARIVEGSERVYLLDENLDRFARVSAGRAYENGPLVFISPEMPLGPEDDVLKAFYDRASSVDVVKGVSVALDAAFRMESYQRAEAERRRAELERLRREEEERRIAEERRAAIVAQLGNAAGRRELAKTDFQEAARAALAVGEAELLDWKSINRNEYVVTYRLDGARYQCVCDEALRISDAGICLVDHRTGVKGDTRFTLESLPAVVREADRRGVLVVFRHV